MRLADVSSQSLVQRDSFSRAMGRVLRQTLTAPLSPMEFTMRLTRFARQVRFLPYLLQTRVVVFLTLSYFPACNVALGYSLSGSSTSDYACTALGADVKNCGSLANACPPSYNGIGFAICKSGCNLRKCSSFSLLKNFFSDPPFEIECPGGYYQYTCVSSHVHGTSFFYFRALTISLCFQTCEW